MSLLKEHDIRVAIVSITWEFGAAWFARSRGADYWVGTGLSESHQISHFRPYDKPVWLTNAMCERGPTTDQVAAAGDSTWNVPMLGGGGTQLLRRRRAARGIGGALSSKWRHPLDHERDHRAGLGQRTMQGLHLFSAMSVSSRSQVCEPADARRTTNDVEATSRAGPGSYTLNITTERSETRDGAPTSAVAQCSASSVRRRGRGYALRGWSTA